MTTPTKKRIPINIITGPLGVGKTTTINHLLNLRPENEKWAVLVNEYGLVGLDAALMSSPSKGGEPTGVEIKELAGGCICCSAGFMFEVSLVMMLQRRPDRLLIEPTGLAALSGILDILDRTGIREAVDVRSIVCLLDPARIEEAKSRKEVQDQVQGADILLANRSDLATSEQLDSFHSWANAFFPPKRHINQIEQGKVSLAILDLVCKREDAVIRGGHQHGTDHAHDHHEHHDHAHDDHHHDHHEHHDHDHEHHDHEEHEHTHDEKHSKEEICDASRPILSRCHRSEVASTVGWICWEGLVFDAERVSCWLSRLSHLPGARRTKAVLHTNEGWWGFNFVGRIEELQPTAYRRDSRIEVVIDGGAYPDTELLEKELRDCLVDTAEIPHKEESKCS